MELAAFSKLFGVFFSALLAGMIPSKSPFYTPKDLADETAIVGVFDKETPGGDSDSVSIEREGPAAYRFTLTGGGATTEFGARLFRLKVAGAPQPASYFLDLTPRQGAGHDLAAGAKHFALMIGWEDGVIHLTPYRADLLPKKPPVLPGGTKRLQRFLREAVARGQFGYPCDLRRRYR